MTLTASLIIAACLIAALNLFVYVANRDGDWHYHRGRMRRFSSNVWEYRPANADEIKENDGDQVW